MKLYFWLATLAALCLTAAGWWDWGHGQAWLAVHTGTDYCPPGLAGQALATCKSYGFWSGFGSVVPWSLFSMGGIFAGLAVGLRHVNCHEKGCWRMGRFALAGGEYKVCGRHHPGFAGNSPPAGHIAEAHENYKQRMHLYLGAKPGKG